MLTNYKMERKRSILLICRGCAAIYSPREYNGLWQWFSPLEASKFTSYDGASVGSPILEKGVTLGVLS
jgi:hypothetical protein